MATSGPAPETWPALVVEYQESVEFKEVKGVSYECMFHDFRLLMGENVLYKMRVFDLTGYEYDAENEVDIKYSIIYDYSVEGREEAEKKFNESVAYLLRRGVFSR